MEKRKYFELKHPEYETDYQYKRINGTTEVEYHFPGIRCDVCGKGGKVGPGRINIDEYPIFKDKKKLLKFTRRSLSRTHRWCIPIDDFHQMLRETFEEKDIERYKDILVPRTDFGDRKLYIKYIPSNMFLFPIYSVQLITEDVLNILIKNKIKGFSYREVILVNKKLSFKQRVYELFVNKEVRLKTGLEDKIKKICEKCGAILYKEEIDFIKMIKSKKHEDTYIYCENIGDVDIFRSPAHATIFVTEKLKNILEENKVKNIVFKQVYCANE